LKGTRNKSTVRPVGRISFREEFVAPILDGRKTSTIRGRKPAHRVGDVVTLHVGPRPPFATARIVAIEPVDWAELSPDQRKRLYATYGDREHLWRVAFAVAEPSTQP